MMCIKMPLLSKKKSLSFIFTLVFISFLAIGGCSENNGGGSGDRDGVDDPAPAPQTMCTTASPPCVVTQTANNTIECGPLPGTNCAVDLEEVVSHVNASAGSALTNDTVMWIEAWGGSGGNTFGSSGTPGAEGGYAITTNSVNDIKAKNGGSSTIYYFYGTPGLNSDQRCGGGGGVATIVTTEDLAMNPSSNPTQSAPPILLVAGGGGGGASGNMVGLCLTSSRNFPGVGGTAIATLTEDGQGPGLGATDGMRGTSTDNEFSMGGNLGGMGSGGDANGGGAFALPTNGNNGFGGLGGLGGTGPGCVGFGANNFSNTPVQLSMTTGLGGNGGSAQGSCAAGGGGGGGGYGGGGGGGSGSEFGIVVAGAGGGSFAIQSTQSSRRVPTTKQPTPCVNSASNGCVRITFAP